MSVGDRAKGHATRGTMFCFGSMRLPGAVRGSVKVTARISPAR
jgi:hypothetical protein